MRPWAVRVIYPILGSSGCSSLNWCFRPGIPTSTKVVVQSSDTSYAIPMASSSSTAPAVVMDVSQSQLERPEPREPFRRSARLLRTQSTTLTGRQLLLPHELSERPAPLVAFGVGLSVEIVADLYPPPMAMAFTEP
jgi:hypothetical protein